MKRCSLRMIAAMLWVGIALGVVGSETDQRLSTTPVVQDAKWAQKWWMPRHKEKLEEIRKAEGKIDVVMIGDSITHGWEKPGKGVFDAFYRERRVLNLGFSGDRTEHVIWRLQNGAVDGIRPKLAILMIGTNNAGHRKEKPDDTAVGIKAILEELKKRLPATRILLLAIFPRGENAAQELRKLNEETNKTIERFADGKQVFWLNINQGLLAEDGTLTKEIMPDLLHPNEKGYRIWAEAMEPKVKELLALPDYSEKP